MNPILTVHCFGRGQYLSILNLPNLVALSQNHSQQETYLNQVHASIQQSLSWYASFQRHGKHLPNRELQLAIRQDLQALKAALEKLDQKIIRIATFGLVSRGKSAVLNALLGQKILETGPINGVTQWPRSVRWTAAGGKVQVELIDTPGLDEIGGEIRENMAQEVVRQADLILFVVAGDITRREYQALLDLYQSNKPLILVFNKIDLYPEIDRKAIYQQLQQLANINNQQLFSPDEIVMVAAEPQPLQVRVEWEDGQVTQQWENTPPQIDELKQTILRVLNREGKTLLGINALLQAKEAQEKIAEKTIKLRQKEAEKIIWEYAQYKALAIAINPMAILDILGGMLTDLVLIRALAKLYGLPMTSYEASKVWRKILLSSGALFFGEIISTIILGLGKTTFAITTLTENPGAFTTFGIVAIIQGSLGGYGAYIVGKAAEEYLKNGCTWGNLGASLVIENILNNVDKNTIIARLRTKLNRVC